MRVASYYSNHDLRIEERPKPKIKKGELLIRVRACGICGTDVLEWYRRDKTPLVLGHEIAGVIEEVGDGLTQYMKGQKISASHHVPCGKCSYCNMGHPTVCETLRKTHFDPGGFAQYLRLPALNVEFGGVYPFSDSLSFEEATFTEPLACALRGQRIAMMQPARSVLILGCGVAGILHIRLAKMKGASLIAACDIVDYRLKQAQKAGAQAVFNAHTQDANQCFRQLNQGKGADLVVVCTGARSAHLTALEAVERGGCVLFFAATDEGITIPISINELFWRNEISLISSYAATPQEHLQALKLLGSRKIDVREMITHRFSLDRIQEGFQLVADARESLKVIINL